MAGKRSGWWFSTPSGKIPANDLRQHPDDYGAWLDLGFCEAFAGRKIMPTLHIRERARWRRNPRMLLLSLPTIGRQADARSWLQGFRLTANSIGDGHF